jgi:hypothetical protein
MLYSTFAKWDLAKVEFTSGELLYFKNTKLLEVHDNFALMNVRLHDT